MAANDFNAAWAASFADQTGPIGETISINGHDCTANVVYLDRAERIGNRGARGADADGEIEVARSDWIAADGSAAASVVVRGIEFEVKDEPTDPEDQGTVTLLLVFPGGN